MALVSSDDQTLIRAVINPTVVSMGFEQMQELLVILHEALYGVAWYVEPVEMVQGVCDHPTQIIVLQEEITDLEVLHFLIVTFYNAMIDERMGALQNGHKDAWNRPIADETLKGALAEFAEMTWEAQESREEGCNLRMVFTTALTWVARVALN